jgi:poly(A) polymerase
MARSLEHTTDRRYSARSKMPSSPGESSGPPCERDDALAVLRRLRDAGHVAYFAGGCVRDLLLGIEPKDFDVATDAPPPRVRQLFTNTQAVGAAFGVILVRHRRSIIEVATFRTDLAYRDGRHPQGVQFTTAEEDAKRRDFTINGLFLDPLDHDRVIDYVGGQEDLKAKRLRAIGNPDDRFAEDHLRLLRAVRFAARFGFEIESTTTTAIVAHAHQLPRIQPERIADELRRMLTPSTRDRAWRLLWSLGLEQQVFRMMPARDNQATNRSLDETRSIFLALAPRDVAVSFGGALAGATLDDRWQRADSPGDPRPWLTKAEIGKVVRAMRQSLKISNEESDELEGTLAGAGAMLNDPPPALAAKKRFLATPTAAGSRALLDALAGVGLFVERIGALRDELAQLERTDYAPPPLITGDDLTAAGATPGPAFKRALDAVYDAQLESRVTTRDEALKMALSVIASAR